MSVSLSLYQPPSFLPEDPLYLDDREQEMKGYGPEWYSLHRFVHKIENITGLKHNKVFLTYGYFYHRVNGKGSLAMTNPRPDLYSDDDLYHWLHLFQGVGFFVVFLWRYITEQVPNCKHLSLWEIMDNSVTLNHFLDLLSLKWSSAKAHCGLINLTRDSIRTNNYKKKAEYQWFGNQSRSRLLNADSILLSIDNKRVTDEMVLFGSSYDPDDFDYIHNTEDYNKKKQRKVNDRKKLIMNWVIEACMLNVRFQPPYTLSWPFTVSPGLLLLPHSNKNTPEEISRKRGLEPYQPTMVTLPPSLFAVKEEKEEQKQRQQGLDSSGAFTTTNKRSRSELPAPPPPKESQQQPTKDNRPLTMEEYYTKDFTKDMIDIKEYEFCLAIIAGFLPNPKEIEEIQTSLLLFQSLTTQVYFVHWVSLYYHQNRMLEGKTQPSQMVREEILELRQALDAYMRKQSW